MARYDKDALTALLPWPQHDANKYSRGKLVLWAGSPAYPGAACLAAYASQRAGAGYTEVVTAPRVVQILQTYRPSLVVRSWDGTFSVEPRPTLPGAPCAYVVGPGFDAAKDSTSKMCFFVLGKAKAPVLVDGGALHALNTPAGLAICASRRSDALPTLITPHAGEAAQLAQDSGIPTDDPAQLAGLLAQRYSAVTVLKGPVTYVSDGAEVYVVANGTPALAKAGTGDVLAGVIGALLAQGLSAMDAAVLGTTLHGKAGSLAAEGLGEISVCAEDVIEHLPAAIRFMRDAAV